MIHVFCKISYIRVYYSKPVTSTEFNYNVKLVISDYKQPISSIYITLKDIEGKSLMFCHSLIV